MSLADASKSIEEKPKTPDDLLAEALKGKSEDFKHRVIDFAGKSGLSKDDRYSSYWLLRGN